MVKKRSQAGWEALENARIVLPVLQDQEIDQIYRDFLDVFRNDFLGSFLADSWKITRSNFESFVREIDLQVVVYETLRSLPLVLYQQRDTRKLGWGFGNRVKLRLEQVLKASSNEMRQNNEFFRHVWSSLLLVLSRQRVTRDVQTDQDQKTYELPIVIARKVSLGETYDVERAVRDILERIKDIKTLFDEKSASEVRESETQRKVKDDLEKVEDFMRIEFPTIRYTEDPGLIDVLKRLEEKSTSILRDLEAEGLLDASDVERMSRRTDDLVRLREEVEELEKEDIVIEPPSRPEHLEQEDLGPEAYESEIERRHEEEEATRLKQRIREINNLLLGDSEERESLIQEREELQKRLSELGQASVDLVSGTSDIVEYFDYLGKGTEYERLPVEQFPVPAFELPETETEKLESMSDEGSNVWVKALLALGDPIARNAELQSIANTNGSLYDVYLLWREGKLPEFEELVKLYTQKLFPGATSSQHVSLYRFALHFPRVVKLGEDEETRRIVEEIMSDLSSSKNDPVLFYNLVMDVLEGYSKLRGEKPEQNVREEKAKLLSMETTLDPELVRAINYIFESGTDREKERAGQLVDILFSIKHPPTGESVELDIEKVKSILTGYGEWATSAAQASQIRSYLESRLGEANYANLLRNRPELHDLDNLAKSFVKGELPVAIYQDIAQRLVGAELEKSEVPKEEKERRREEVRRWQPSDVVSYVVDKAKDKVHDKESLYSFLVSPELFISSPIVRTDVEQGLRDLGTLTVSGLFLKVLRDLLLDVQGKLEDEKTGEAKTSSFIEFWNDQFSLTPEDRRSNVVAKIAELESRKNRLEKEMEELRRAETPESQEKIREYEEAIRQLESQQKEWQEFLQNPKNYVSVEDVERYGSVLIGEFYANKLLEKFGEFLRELPSDARVYDSFKDGVMRLAADLRRATKPSQVASILMNKIINTEQPVLQVSKDVTRGELPYSQSQVRTHWRARVQERNWRPGIEMEEPTWRSRIAAYVKRSHRVVDDPSVASPYETRKVWINGRSYDVVRIDSGSEVYDSKTGQKLLTLEGVWPYRVLEIRQRLMGDIPSQTDTDKGRLASRSETKVVRSSHTSKQKSQTIRIDEPVTAQLDTGEEVLLYRGLTADIEEIHPTRGYKLRIPPSKFVNNGELELSNKVVWVKPEDLYFTTVIRESNVRKQAVIVHRKDGWYVLTKDRKRNLGGPYATEEEAKKRLRQIEYFKHKSGSLSFGDVVRDRQTKQLGIVVETGKHRVTVLSCSSNQLKSFARDGLELLPHSSVLDENERSSLLSIANSKEEMVESYQEKLRNGATEKKAFLDTLLRYNIHPKHVALAKRVLHAGVMLTKDDLYDYQKALKSTSYGGSYIDWLTHINVGDIVTLNGDSAYRKSGSIGKVKSIRKDKVVVSWSDGSTSMVSIKDVTSATQHRQRQMRELLEQYLKDGVKFETALNRVNKEMHLDEKEKRELHLYYIRHLASLNPVLL